MKRLSFILISILITIQLHSLDKTLYTKDLIKIISESNSSIELSSANTNLAKAIYDQVINNGKPSISFSTGAYDNPLFSYNNYTTDTDAFSISGGVNISQNLPTGGSLSFSINESFDFNYTDELEILHTPDLNLTIYQPIFVNERIFDFKSKSDSERFSNLTYSITKINEVDTKNQILIGVLTSIHSINIMRNTILLLEKNLEITKQKVIIGNDDRTRGRISSSELLYLELNVANERERLFDMKYKLKIAEVGLENILGYDDVSNTGFNLQLEENSNYTLNTELVGRNMNSEEYKASLEVEQAELKMRINSVQNASQLTLFLDSSADDLNTSTDFDISFGAAIEANIWDSGVDAKRLEADAISINIAKIKLKEIQNGIVEDRNILEAKVALLKEKLILIETNIDYDNQLLDRERDLETLGISTQLNVDVLELDLLNRLKDVENIKGELYITILQLTSMNGLNIEDLYD